MSNLNLSNQAIESSKPTLSGKARETAENVASHAGDAVQDAASHYVLEPAEDLFGLAKAYAKDNPDVAACWAFALGVVVGWKLKP